MGYLYLFWTPGAYIAGYRVDICFAFVSYYYYYFLTIFVSPIISTSTGRIFTARFHYGCRWTIWTSIFEFSRDVAIATKFRFLKFRIFAITPKQCEIRHGPGKENVGKFVFCRVAPSVLTSDDPDSQNCIRFVLLLQVRFAQKVPQQTLPWKQIFVIFGHFPSDPVAILLCSVSIHSLCCCRTACCGVVLSIRFVADMLWTCLVI